MQDKEGNASRLTYADVHMVLALLQGWGEGTVSLRHDGLAMDAVLSAAPAAVLAIRSPAVGIFRPQTPVATLLRSGEPLALIEGFGRSMTVVSPSGGKLLRLLIAADAFVEYDQEIALIEPAGPE
jgi:biotin carboxyl carrier protein